MADTSELRSILKNINFYIKNNDDDILSLYAPWILNSYYFQMKCDEYDKFGKGYFSFAEFCIICEQTFQYLSLDENNYHLDYCEVHGTNSKYNSLIDYCDTCLKYVIPNSTMLLGVNKKLVVQAVILQSKSDIMDKDDNEPISLSSWNTPKGSDDESGDEIDINISEGYNDENDLKIDGINILF